MKTLSTALLILILLQGQSATTLAEDLQVDQPPAQFTTTVPDLLIVRPFAALGAVITTSAFLATLPVTYPLGKDLELSRPLVDKPWTYVSDRPLGVFAPGKSMVEQIDDKVSKQYQEYFGRVGANRSPLVLK